jgi:23S rRNA (adenine2030-N6)-methyltransferase
MLSYLHGFHAGNFADVHKHTALCVALHLMKRKEKPFTYIDTHAGSGLYNLTNEQALKTGEFKFGIKAIRPHFSSCEAMTLYGKVIDGSNDEGDLTAYPGSPLIARTSLRQQDQAILCELHPTENGTLNRILKRDKRFHIHKRDGLEALIALTPPPIKRGMVMIDPSYEIKSDYYDTAQTVIAAYKRWPGATYMIWYPLLPENRHQTLLEGLARSSIPAILKSELTCPQKGRGMYGSGLIALNPPYGFKEAIKQAGLIMAAVLFDAHKGQYSEEFLT